MVGDRGDNPGDWRAEAAGGAGGGWKEAVEGGRREAGVRKGPVWLPFPCPSSLARPNQRSSFNPSPPHFQLPPVREPGMKYGGRDSPPPSPANLITRGEEEGTHD